MLLLGIDLGTSSIKVSVVDAQSQECIVSAQYPETESGIITVQPGWAEQEPGMWWEHVQKAILKAHATKKYNPQDISAIGIAYQMHGLVMVDNKKEALRPSIIWCDSRAVSIGEKAFKAIGEQKALSRLLNSPGNFTASKLAWVKANEPALYAQTDKIMLPGDYIAMKLTGTITTSISALSEGIFWDFKEDSLSEDVFLYYGFEKSFVPGIQPVFSIHGLLQDDIAGSLALKKGIPVSYKAGDQPNNALSLNVFEPGEVAATAGTSGVIYAVSDKLTFDKQSRVNSFAHVNYATDKKKIGVLLCINGTGILNRWLKNIFGAEMSYEEMNKQAATINPGSEGLVVSPFGNGAERMLGNAIPGAQFENIDLNIHTQAHLARAGQEGIAFAFRYGLDIMRENNIHPTIIRAGRANMFLSNVFTESLVNAINVPVELHPADGSVGAALGAGIGAGIFKNAKDAFVHSKPLKIVEPANTRLYDGLYNNWKQRVFGK